MYDAVDAPDPDPPPATENDAVAAWRKAASAARGAAATGWLLLGMTAFWIAWVLYAVAKVPAQLASGERMITSFHAELVPLIISGATKISLPTPVAFTLVLFGPLLAAFASVRLWRDITRTPARVGFDLALLLGGCAIAILPGLMLQIQFTHRYSGGGGSSGLGPAPMCGGLTLLVAAYAGFVRLHHGAALHEGPPAGTDPD